MLLRKGRGGERAGRGEHRAQRLRRRAHVAIFSAVRSSFGGGIAVTSITTPEAMRISPIAFRHVNGSFIRVAVMMPLTKTLVAPIGATIEAGAYPYAKKLSDSPAIIRVMPNHQSGIFVIGCSGLPSVPVFRLCANFCALRAMGITLLAHSAMATPAHACSGRSRASGRREMAAARWGERGAPRNSGRPRANGRLGWLERKAAQTRLRRGNFRRCRRRVSLTLLWGRRRACGSRTSAAPRCSFEQDGAYGAGWPAYYTFTKKEFKNVLS